MTVGKVLIWPVVLIGCTAAVSAGADATISFSLVPVGETEVSPGALVTLDVRATFNTRMSAAAFTLSADGGAQAELVARSADPTAPNGLTYVSLTSQDPFEGGLPADLSAAPVTEVLFDNDFDNTPGGATDGLPPESNVLIEQLSIRLAGTGSVTVSLSDVSAAHTTGPPDGSLFDVMSIGVASVTYTVSPPCGDSDEDGDADLIDWGVFQRCYTGPGVAATNPDCAVMDCDDDTDVDLDDHAEFVQVAISGGG